MMVCRKGFGMWVAVAIAVVVAISVGTHQSRALDAARVEAAR